MNEIKESQALLKGTLIGGIFGSLLSIIPGAFFINCCCCLGIIISGIISSYAVVRFKEQANIEPIQKDVIRIGVYTGVITTVIVLIFNIIKILVTINNTTINEQIITSIQKYKYYFDSIPNSDVFINKYIEELRKVKTNNNVPIIIIGTFFSLIVNVVFSIIGASIGIKLFVKEEK